jgi:hypothetical protein
VLRTGGHEFQPSTMKHHKSILASVICGGIILTAIASTGDLKSYQVTGPVLEVTPTSITVQKGKDEWQLSRDKGTKVSGDVKVGSKVTIYYTMMASEIDVKEKK